LKTGCFIWFFLYPILHCFPTTGVYRNSRA